MIWAGLWDGVIHPVLGLDHLLAMASVGVVSAILGGRAMWAVPLVFVLAMAAGGVAGLQGAAFPRAESIIAMSLVVLGACIPALLSIQAHGRATGVLIGCAVLAFGAAHGNMHGLEVPQAVSPSAFVVGFVIGTSALHLAGVAIGIASCARKGVAWGARVFGLFAAGLGLGLLLRG